MHPALNVEELRLALFSPLNREKIADIASVSKSFRSSFLPIIMMNLLISPRHLDVLFAYSSSKTAPDPAHPFISATVDLAVSPGNILYFLSKSSTQTVRTLKIENSLATGRGHQHLDIVLAEICSKFPIAKEIEVLGMNGTLQKTILNSFSDMTTLTLHVPIGETGPTYNITLGNLKILVVADREPRSAGSAKESFSVVAARIWAPHLEELNIIGNLRGNLPAVRELVRRYSSTLQKLGILDDKGPSSEWHTMGFPFMEHLRTLVLDVSWTSVYINGENAFQQSLPGLRTLVLQSGVQSVFAGLVEPMWNKVAEGLTQVQGSLEVIRLEIRGETGPVPLSFAEVVKERLREVGASMQSFSVEEGECELWPESTFDRIPRRNRHGGNHGWGDGGRSWEDGRLAGLKALNKYDFS
ncbi:hypothetical protein V5O48_004510 [Marasmius crinis-equi]|uniref:F-box domain-containing protein n=1 Tax=Marasmius crinis-equi TaxID=585013 RepID=A0ABR3FQU8_9AGAR